MAKGDVETYYENGEWKNRAQGNSRASNIHDTKADAVAVGRQMARQRQVEHLIKNRDGRMGKGSGSKQSYGKDSFPPRGWRSNMPDVIPL